MSSEEARTKDESSPSPTTPTPHSKAGVVFLSRIPPTMTPHELRAYLEPFGRLGRVYLAPDEKTVKSGRLTSKDPRDHRKARFTEGWVEFLRRRDAKTAALALNGSLIGGKKSNRFHDDIWNIKYLRGFQWSNLTEETTYRRAVRQQKLRAEISQARRANQQYVRQAERAVAMEKKAARKAQAEGVAPVSNDKNQVAAEQMQILHERFRQRKPVLKEDS